MFAATFSFGETTHHEFLLRRALIFNRDALEAFRPQIATIAPTITLPTAFKLTSCSRPNVNVKNATATEKVLEIQELLKTEPKSKPPG